MKCKYSESTGYYGTGGWVCLDSAGDVWKVFGTEEEAKAYCARFGGVK